MSILQGTIPSDWDGEYCRYAVCWPNSPQWLAILRGVLVLPSRGRFWDEHTGNILEAQEVIRQTYDQNLHLKEVLMACGDEGLASIAISLNKIASAMLATSGGCCERGGSGGAPETDPPFVETPETNPDVDPPPNGFDTWEDFFNQKCSVAYDIVANLQADLATMASMSWGSAALEAITAALVVLLITPVVGAAIIALVGLLATVGAVIVLTTALDIINQNTEDLICELFNGTDSQSSRSLFLGKFGDLVDSGVADPVSNFAIKTLMSYLLGPSATNRLYEKDLTRIWALQDCLICETCQEGVDFLYDANLGGWGLISQSCNSGEDFPSHASAVVAWNAASGGSMRMTANAASPITVCTAESPAINEVVLPGHQIVFQFQNGPNPAFLRVRINTDLHCDVLNAVFEIPANNTDEVTFPLTIWETETIETIQIYVANSVNQSITFDVMKVQFNCA